MDYSRGEEIANSITHGVGTLFSIVSTTLLIAFAVIYGSTIEVISSIVFGITLMLMYTSSTLYHALTPAKVKKVFKVFDHSSIYLLIAGTYTPFILMILKGNSNITWIIFTIIWTLAILGIIFSALFIGKFRVLKTLMYILMGWMILIAMPDLINILTIKSKLAVIYTLFAGGISYTFGTIFYLIKKIKYFHSIWHLFVLAGSVLHFISIFMCII